MWIVVVLALAIASNMSPTMTQLLLFRTEALPVGTLGTWGLGAQASGHPTACWINAGAKVVEAQVAKPQHNWAAMRAAGPGVRGRKELVTPVD